jgi:hypothetical protein
MSDADIFPTLAVLVAGTIILVVAQTRLTQIEARWAAVSFVAHVLSSFVQLWMVLSVYGIGDMLMYHGVGIDLAHAMRSDFFGVAPQVVLAVLQQPYNLSIFIPAAGSATGSMCALVGIASVALGDSLMAVNLSFALAAFFGKLLLYGAFRPSLGERTRSVTLVAMLLVPSSVFWSAGILKEAVAMPGLGLYALGLERMMARSQWGVVAFVIGGIVLAIAKPYILVALVPATGLYLYWRRTARRGGVEFRPLTLAFGAAVTVFGLLVIGELSPRFSMDRIAEETARMQAASANPTAGSGYAIGDPNERTLFGQLGYAPFALFTALFRPLPPEVRNPQMAVSALENVALLAMTLWVFVRNPIRRLWQQFVRYPYLALCATFVLVFGVAVGLTSVNLGTLSRYRIPLMPFRGMILAVLAQPSPVTSMGPQQRAVRVGRLPAGGSA